MINELIRDCDTDLAARPANMEAVLAGERQALARTITCLQAGALPEPDQAALRLWPIPGGFRCSVSPAPAGRASPR